MKKIFLLSVLMLPLFGCLDGKSARKKRKEKPTSGETITNPQNSEPAFHLEKIQFDSEVLAHITTQIAEKDPMRGGYFFGNQVDNNTAEIKYFLFDYASKPSSGAYTLGDNINSNLAITQAYREDHQPTAMKWFGTVHSSPGTISYVFGSNETVMEKNFENNPFLKFHILGVITMGPANMQNLQPHELKLSDNAKMSIYVKERGKKIAPFTNFTTVTSDKNVYQEMESHIVHKAHITDVVNDLDLHAQGLTDVQTFDDKVEKITFARFFFGDKLEIVSSVKLDYPLSPPTLACFPKDDKGDGPPSVLEEASKWKTNVDDPKNYYNFFKDFVQNKCRPQDYVKKP